MVFTSRAVTHLIFTIFSFTPFTMSMEEKTKVAQEDVSNLKVVTLHELRKVLKYGHEWEKHPLWYAMTSVDKQVPKDIADHCRTYQITFDANQFVIKESNNKKEVICTLPLYVLKKLIEHYNLADLLKTDFSRAYPQVTNVCTWVEESHDNLSRMGLAVSQLIKEFNDRPVVTFSGDNNTISLPRTVLEKIPYFATALTFHTKKPHDALSIFKEASPLACILFKEMIFIISQSHDNAEDPNAHQLITHLCTLLEAAKLLAPDQPLPFSELMDLALTTDIPVIAQALLRYLQLKHKVALPIEDDVHDQRLIDNLDELLDQLATHLNTVHFKKLMKNPYDCGFLTRCFIRKLALDLPSVTQTELDEIVDALVSNMPLILSPSIKQTSTQSAYLNTHSNEPHYTVGKEFIELLSSPACPRGLVWRLPAALQKKYRFQTDTSHWSAFQSLGLDGLGARVVEAFPVGQQYLVLNLHIGPATWPQYRFAAFERTGRERLMVLVKHSLMITLDSWYQMMIKKIVSSIVAQRLSFP